MALENIQQAVLESARTQAEHIVQAAQKAADEKLKAFRDAETHEAEKRFQAATRAIEEEFARKLIQHIGAGNKKLLEKRNAVLGQVFEQARERLLHLPAPEYAALMRKLLEAAAGQQGGRLRIHPSDAAAFNGVLAELNRGRAAETTLEIDTAAPLAERGGFVLLGQGYEIDQTLGTLLADLEHELAPQIAAGLFAEKAS